MVNDKIKTAITLFAIIFALSWIIAGLFKLEIKVGNVALIKINAPIAIEKTDFFTGETVSSESIVKFIEDANENPDIKAILIDINSPGGSPVASAEIAEAIKKVNKTKVALIREMATSGAYWVASSADEIVAHPLSITGSIGVLGSYLEFSKLLENYNITYRRLVAGEYKDIGTPFKELTEDEKMILQDIINKIQKYFISDVATNRNLSDKQVKEIATGRIYLGLDAKEIGLVDVLGGKAEAEKIIKEKTNLTEIIYSEYVEKKRITDILSTIFKETGFFIGEGINSGALKEEYNIKT